MERLRCCSAAHLQTTWEAKKMMMRSRLGELLLQLDADTTEAEVDAASKEALLTQLERGAEHVTRSLGPRTAMWL
jgi:hypothetical protein